MVTGNDNTLYVTTSNSHLTGKPGNSKWFHLHLLATGKYFPHRDHTSSKRVTWGTSVRDRWVDIAAYLRS